MASVAHLSDRLRTMLRIGAICLVLGALGWAWELLALQAPSSPWHLGGFPSAIERFATHAWMEGLAIFALAPRAWSLGFSVRPALGRACVGALSVGTPAALGALGYAAATGVLGFQIRRSDHGPHALVVVRLLGEGLLFAALLAGIWATLGPSRSQPSAQPPG